MQRTNPSEHPDGLLIDEAAKQWLPRLYATWQGAWDRWTKLGRGGSFTVNHRGELINPEQHHPLLAAAVKADAALKDACRREFALSEWIVSGLVGALRTRIDSDFLRNARLNFLDRTARGAFNEGIVVSALRVRPASDLNSERPPIAPAAGPAGAAEKQSPAFQKPTYSERSKFSPKKRPNEFLEWAQRERRSVGIITQSNAKAAMAKIFDDPPIGPSGRIVIAWCRSLPSEWTAKKGTSPSRIRSSDR